MLHFNFRFMNEAFLHYVWQYQHFDRAELKTTTGEVVSIFNPGMKNADAGPDFFNAKVRIGDFFWSGNVEIHIQSSEWVNHRHHADPAYENVILHVVWHEDQSILRKDKSKLPTVELKGRIADELLLNYKKLINQTSRIPCAVFLPRVPDIKKILMVERALAERVERKATGMLDLFKHNNLDWEQTTFQLLCRNFGFKVNSNAFERLAEILPYKILLKHTDQLLQVEALMFGQAGFLDNSSTNEYFQKLKREYLVLSRKYGFGDRTLSRSQWRFLRLRPANFPTLRIAQLVALICKEKNIFSRIVNASNCEELTNLFGATQSEYWQKHYNFEQVANDSVPALGNESIFNIIVNTVVPLMVAYGKLKDNQERVDKALDILYQIPSENNAIIRSWLAEGIQSRTAGESQGLIELFNNFCLKKRCLDCSIGFSLIQPPE